MVIAVLRVSPFVFENYFLQFWFVHFLVFFGLGFMQNFLQVLFFELSILRFECDVRFFYLIKPQLFPLLAYLIFITPFMVVVYGFKLVVFLNIKKGRFLDQVINESGFCIQTLQFWVLDSEP